MRNLMCSVYFKNGKDILPELFEIVFDHFGFAPAVMKIQFGAERTEEDLFDIKSCISFLSDDFSSIYIQNKFYDESSPNNFFWFNISRNAVDDTISINWKNSSLSFLFDNNWVHNFFNIKKFICCYFYNYDDVFAQSYQQVSFHERNGGVFKKIKDLFGNDIVDVSENYGRSVRINGIEIMAAPKMWFGESFFEIISKDLLLKSGGVYFEDETLIYIDLFDLEEFPVTSQSRSKQKMFWNTCKIDRLIAQIKSQKESQDEFMKSIEDLIAKKRKK